MKERIPNHVGIILDGNGRWAAKKGLPRSKGHLAGYKTLKKIAPYALEKGVKYLSIFAFSTENFKREEKEVDFLMNLFIQKFKKDISYFNKNNVKVVFSGRKKPLKEEVYKAMEKMTKATSKNTGGILNICLNYGGRSEIIDATKKIIDDLYRGYFSTDAIDEEFFKRYLYQDLPDLDLVIRTSKEIRISNFMLYQLSYAELYFPKVLFPDFTSKDFDKALRIYSRRNRRFGGIKK